ncbi:MAG: cytochrome c biogenesis protein ResB [Candidatus Omnitrophica bacterium]|nr:cytochrome c biogenesis protein ResB [Candidatus Omnitrophota bacterium]
MKSFFQKLFQFLRSMRLINFLLILLAVASAFGTFPHSFKFLPFASEDIFHHGWFLILLGYLALLSGWYVVQRTGRLLREIRYPTLLLSTPIQPMGPPKKFGAPFQLIPTHKRLIVKIISDQRYDSKIEKKTAAYIVSAWKNRWGIWGGALIHMGFSVVFLGGLLTFLFSDVRDLMIPEGETITLSKSQTKMKLEKFAVLFNSGEFKPENYVSHLLIEKKGKITRKSLLVNHPVKIGQAKLFQMRYRVEILSVGLLVYQRGKTVERIELAPKEKKALSQVPLLLEVNDIIPDFMMNKEGAVASRTPYFRNPAALISIYSADEPEKLDRTIWAFPDLVSHDGKEAEEWSFVIERIKKRYISGIKLSQDPGVPFAYTGFIFLILGGFISAFVIPRQFMILFKPISEGGGTQMEIFCHRTKDIFGLQRDLSVIKSKLSGALEVPGA